MGVYKNNHFWTYLSMIFVLGVTFLTGCGNNDNPILPPTVLLDVTQQLAPNGCAAAIFNGQAGDDVDITATGPANENPDLFVFDPSSTQVAAAQSPNLGIETLGFTPAVTGAFTVQVCDVNNVGGAVRVRVVE